MKTISIEFKLDLSFDAENAVAERGEAFGTNAYVKAWEESVHEFSQELRAFLEKHPMVQACTMNTSEKG